MIYWLKMHVCKMILSSILSSTKDVLYSGYCVCGSQSNKSNFIILTFSLHMTVFI